MLSEARQSEFFYYHLADRQMVAITTTLALARASAVGCIGRLDRDMTAVNVWDPTAGTGFAGSLLVDALQSAGVETHYRGQDINCQAVEGSVERLASDAHAVVYVGDSLTDDVSGDFFAALVIVEPP